MESRPVFWHMLHLVAEEGTHTRTHLHSSCHTLPLFPPLPDAASVVQFHGIALSLCSLLSAHWQHSRVDSTTEQPRELEATCSLVELCRKVGGAPVGVVRATVGVVRTTVGVVRATVGVGGATVGVVM